MPDRLSRDTDVPEKLLGEHGVARSHDHIAKVAEERRNKRK
jgi:hypothetical protein